MTDSDLTYEDVSKMFNVKISTVRKWVRRRWIPCIRYGHRTVRFQYCDLMEFRNKRKVKAI